MYQVNLKHADEKSEIGVFVADAANEKAAIEKALAILGANLGLAEGFTATLVRKLDAALIPDTADVMFVPAK